MLSNPGPIRADVLADRKVERTGTIDGNIGNNTALTARLIAANRERGYCPFPAGRAGLRHCGMIKYTKRISTLCGGGEAADEPSFTSPPLASRN
jgi:hypothetical protein